MKLTVNRADLLITALIAVFYIFLSFRAFPLLESVERIVYSVEMRLDLPRSMGENKIAIVNIDEKSLNQLGPWPWPRSLIAEMIRILKANGAKLIGLDLVFSQKEQNQGLKEVKGLYEAISQQQETTGEKAAMGWFLDGRVSLVLGTHTHVPTRDARVLPEGTGYVTDVGMTGAHDSVIGVDKAAIIQRFLNMRPTHLDVAQGDLRCDYIVADIDDDSGKTRDIEHEQIKVVTD